MKQKLLMAFMCAIAIGCLAACGSSKEIMSSKETMYDSEQGADLGYLPSLDDDNVKSQSTTDETELPQTINSNEWLDLENMQFSINGKIYTLGKTTLQEMIDDGCPFKTVGGNSRLLVSEMKANKKASSVCTVLLEIT